MVQTPSILLFQMSSNASCGNVIWVALSKLVLGNAAISTALVTTGCGPVKITLDPTPGDINYFWPHSEPDHSLDTFQGKHFMASPRPEALRALIHRSSLAFKPGRPWFLWKWVIIGNSHMCCPRQRLPWWRLRCSPFSHVHCLPPAVLAGGQATALQ